MVNMNGQVVDGNFMPPCISNDLVTLPIETQSDQYKAQTSETSSFEPSSVENKYNPTNQKAQNFNFDSVLSTPMSSPTPLNSSSNFVNSSSTSTEDDRETYCSMFKFEIPESFEFEDFIL